MSKNITILAISGSLRSNSSNAAVINTVADYAKDKVNLVVYKDLGKIPPFDDGADTHSAVSHFRDHIRSADGVFICSPEYAFGVPGVLKNAIDWTVSSGEFVNKPVALVTAATGGKHAHEHLLSTFSALSAQIPDSSKLLISYVRSKLDEHNNVKDRPTKEAIHDVFESLITEIAYQYM